MGFRVGIVAALSGALISLAGAAAAALVVTVLVAAAPGMAQTPAFLWSSVLAATLLHGALGFAAGRFASRRLLGSGASGATAAALSCAGPVLVGLLTQAGLAAQGRPGLSLLVVCGAALGSAVGFGTVSYGYRAAR